jgi:hypothetical protein
LSKTGTADEERIMIDNLFVEQPWLLKELIFGIIAIGILDAFIIMRWRKSKP